MSISIAAEQIHHEAASCQATASGYTGGNPDAKAFLESIMASFNQPNQALEAAAHQGTDFAQQAVAAAANFVKDMGKTGR